MENLLELAESTRSAQRLQRERRARRERLAQQYDLRSVVFESQAMESVVELACRVARATVPVLILGPNGAGKERIAEIVHANSSVKSGPFVALNCGAIPADLVEAELFGAEAGAYTGANKARVGRFEAADGGTLFLDEIGNLPLAGQVKLLRVLETGQFEQLGSSRTRSSRVRIVSATNADLPTLIREGRFREDLYYRLNVVPLHLPPLRDRREDIPELVAHFLDIYNEQNDRYVAHIDPRALAALQQYQWPGNVRELQNYVERAVVMAPGDELTLDLLPTAVTTGRTPRAIGVALDFDSLAEELVHLGLGDAGTEAADIHSRIVDRVEREVIEQVLHECEGVQIKAASRLGINRNTLHKKLKQYGLDGEAPPTK
jgi:DNA-binding NtrC family response regulator